MILEIFQYYVLMEGLSSLCENMKKTGEKMVQKYFEKLCKFCKKRITMYLKLV